MLWSLLVFLIGCLVLAVVLDDVCPAFMTDDCADDAVTDAVFVRESLLSDAAGSVADANRANRVVSQFGIPSFVDSLALSSFRFHIRDVVKLSAEPQVGRVDAKRVVARMQDMPVFGDRAVGQHPCHSVGEYRAARLPAEELAVTGKVGAARPRPAIFAHPDLFAEAFN